MSVVAKVGERIYEFENTADLVKAREVYVCCIGDQNKFEAELESEGIEFWYDSCN